MPAAVRARQLGRYFVRDESAGRRRRGAPSGAATSAPQRIAAAGALRAQEGAIAQAKSLGGTVTFRYKVLVNAFSAQLSAKAAAALAQRADVQSVQPVSIVRMSLDDQRAVHRRGPGVEQLRRPRPGDAGRDRRHRHRLHPRFVRRRGHGRGLRGERPDVHRDRQLPDRQGDRRVRLRRATTTTSWTTTPSNDIPRPDFDPLDSDGHGTHTGSTVAGINVPGQVGRGVAPLAVALRLQGVGRRQLDRRRPGRRVRAGDGPEPGRQRRRRGGRPVLLRRRGLRHVELDGGQGGAAGRRPRNGVRGLGRELGQPAGRRVCLHLGHALDRARRDRRRGLDRRVPRARADINSTPTAPSPVSRTTDSRCTRTGRGPSRRAASPTTCSTDGRSTTGRSGGRTFCDPLAADSLDGRDRARSTGATAPGSDEGVQRPGGGRGRRRGLATTRSAAAVRPRPANGEDDHDPVVHDLRAPTATRSSRSSARTRPGRLQRGDGQRRRSATTLDADARLRRRDDRASRRRARLGSRTT